MARLGSMHCSIQLVVHMPGQAGYVQVCIHLDSHTDWHVVQF